jgi:hypothetical protein
MQRDVVGEWRPAFGVNIFGSRVAGLKARPKSYSGEKGKPRIMHRPKESAARVAAGRTIRE